MSIELAWAAGFFDGEGTTCCIQRKGRKDGYRISMSIPQVHIGPLERFHKVVAGGRICLRNARSERAQACYVWQAQSYDECKKVRDLLEPYWTDIKKEQASKAFEVFETSPSFGRKQGRPKVNAD